MARPQKKGLLYNPQLKTYYSKMRDKKYYRNSSSAYIKKQEVRDFIFNRDNHTCLECKSKDNITVDHIITVIYGFENHIDLFVINNIGNLQTLCGKCNSKKSSSELSKGVVVSG